MQPVLNVEDVKRVESGLTEVGVSISELMHRAGTAAANEVVRMGDAERVTIFCGLGNNGGDGWVAAESLLKRSLDVTVITPVDPDDIQADLARVVAKRAQSVGVKMLVAPPKDEVEALFGNGLLLVGICLLITAALLALSEWLQKKRQSKGHEVGYKDAFIIGIAQACAVLPGLSRSGTTIATGLLCGVKKESVAQFSFLMVLIPILGEALLDGIKIIQGEVTSELDILPAVVGFVAAFVTGCLACRFMIEIVRRQRLVWFAIYCAIIGTTAILATVC
jgi:hypothetical protein